MERQWKKRIKMIFAVATGLSLAGLAVTGWVALLADKIGSHTLHTIILIFLIGFMVCLFVALILEISDSDQNENGGNLPPSIPRDFWG